MTSENHQTCSSNMLNILVALTAVMSSVSTTEMRYLCGARLADALELVCADRGFYRTLSKRHEPGAEIMHISADAPDVVKRSVVNECCRRACSLPDLEAYCAPGPMDSDHLFDGLIETSGSERGGQSGGRSPHQRPGLSNRPLQISGHQPEESNHRYKIRGRPSGIYKNRSYFYVTPARSEFNIPDLSHRRH